MTISIGNLTVDGNAPAGTIIGVLTTSDSSGTLKLVGNSIELNRNLSSADVGVLGPFTIEASQNGMSAAATFNLSVTGAAGPVPLPSPTRFSRASHRSPALRRSPGPAITS